ncbi:helix-turn-helix domain-containing protein [Domibacillus sp. DTU_2020_1001157_1_SI_ALB_TIR_016]|uniref:helix-turn-helix domain-containing protein n=1 Tax=Domibacillus sp. DTU_2020_1001157_1_SI_ALB_TIR_016 TaxID=3077789 RepID=UPI0028EDEE1E|nr:helix-turn-helix domain-containing protein [Domibacillus sp. DTU_2020_1001157_1_SI_ALB_TIR_016]WNS82227.1 helix-turn-helix domain-containing protein [Domibacillus sp. DTU_2020_1001157_1_SI_ALB_TIR_016]
MKTKMTIKEAAAFLGVYPGTLYRYVQEGSVPHYRVGRRIFFSQETLSDWINRQEGM